MALYTFQNDLTRYYHFDKLSISDKNSDNLLALTTRIMNTLLVSYDLITPGRNYEPLRKFLESHSSWAKPVQSLYMVKSSKSAESLRNDLTPFLDTNDKIIVIDVTSDAAAWKGLSEKVSDWIKKNL